MGLRTPLQRVGVPADSHIAARELDTVALELFDDAEPPTAGALEPLADRLRA